MTVATEATAEPSISPYCLALVSLGAIRLPLSAKKKIISLRTFRSGYNKLHFDYVIILTLLNGVMDANVEIAFISNIVCCRAQ